MYTGPHIIKDGLVFGYDTGYGVADNYTGTRFYKGEPTTNFMPTVYISGSNITSGTDEIGQYREGTLTRIGCPYGTSINSGATYTFSIEIRADKAFTMSADSNQYAPENSGNDYNRVSVTYIRPNYTTPDKWVKYSTTVVMKSGLTNPTMFDFFMPQSFTGRMYYRNAQLEYKSHVTPFTSSTRSSTASLIDLKETTDIDVSNVSFDSTGQPTFDGSDDRITIPAGSFETIGTNDFTIEVVCKNTKTSNYNHFFSVKDQYHFALKSHNLSSYILYVYRTSALSTSSAIPAYIPSRSDYYHIVCKRQGDNLEIFVNGVSKGTKSGWDNISIDNDSWPSYIGWGNTTEYTGGNIPLVKVYNKALTASEIKQNFNAYKNRFSI